MERSPVVLGMAAVFAGCTVVLTVAALAYREPLVLIVAAPFAISAYFFWYQVTGRLEARVRRRAARARARAAADPGQGGFGAGPREDWRPPGERVRSGAAGRTAGADPRTGRRRAGGPGERDRSRGRRRDAGASGTGPTEAEARRLLGVDRGADGEAVRRAYRDRVKEVHPDTESGSEEAFRRVQAAYERLTD